MSTISTPIIRYHAAEGLEVRIYKNGKRFSVQLRDMEAGENVPFIKIFDNLEKAKLYAIKIARGA
jgi:hypothetical protein